MWTFRIDSEHWRHLVINSFLLFFPGECDFFFFSFDWIYENHVREMRININENNLRANFTIANIAFAEVKGKPERKNSDPYRSCIQNWCSAPPTRSVPTVLCWKVAHENAKKSLKKIAKNPKSCSLNFLTFSNKRSLKLHFSFFAMINLALKICSQMKTASNHPWEVN